MPVMPANVVWGHVRWSGWSSGFQITRLIHPEMDDELMRAATFGVSKHPQALNSQERLGSDSQLDQLALDGIAGGSSAEIQPGKSALGRQVARGVRHGSAKLLVPE